MKALFLFLLLLNILYGLWQLQDGRAIRSLQEVDDSAVELLRERQTPTPVAEVLPVVPLEDPVRGAAPRLCMNLGEFDERIRAQQLRQRLLALGIQSEVIGRDVPAAGDYWLVMEIVGGRSEALAQLAVLQDRGVDSFLITEGPLVNNVSLGVFSREDYAQARRAQLQVLGHNVQVEPVDKVETRYVVQIGVIARRLVDQALLGRLREDFPGLQHQYKACSGGKVPAE